MIIPKLQDLREDADLTQAQIGKMLSISQRTYSHYESGSREIPLELLIKLADYYNISLDELVGRKRK